MPRPAIVMAAAVVSAIVTIALVASGTAESRPWTAEERRLLESLTLAALPPLPPDPSNRVADDPAAVELGRALFFDTRFSADGRVACATCHLPDRQFQDDRPLGRGVGETSRRTMPIAGTAHSPWLFWDGRKDSLWAQALGPLESPVEHGGDRTRYAHLVAEHYRGPYEKLFGPLPDLGHLPPSAGPVADERTRAAWESMSSEDREAVTRIFVNMGKAIAAFERRIQFGPARFDNYVSAVIAGREPAADAQFTDDELAGLRLFLGKGECVNCHNGPLFTDNHFHNTGVPPVVGLPEDRGRLDGARQVRDDPFNCLGPYSDAAPSDCAELRFMVTDGSELIRAFKPPTLRNVAERPPYMHAGQIATLREVLEHYNRAPAAPAGQSELHPLSLSATEIRQLEAFLGTLSGPVVSD